MRLSPAWGAIGALLLAGGVEALPPQAAPGVYQAPDREPTPEETLILELMNRFRSNPPAEAEIIVPLVRAARKDLQVDWEMFQNEMKALKPMPPLVMNLDLLDAARKHSWYMIQNSMEHEEVAGKAGYTGVEPWDRMKAAGYKNRARSAENIYRNAASPWVSHWGFVVDDGPGPGNMQTGRGHRRNMNGPFTEVGTGAVPHKEGLAVTHDFGDREGRRAGGVVYIDLNGNKFYDVDEGLRGVAVAASDGSSITTWKGGSYTMDLKGDGAVTLTASLDGEKFTKAFPASKDNVKFDWIVPAEVPLRRADRYLAAVEKAGDPGTPRHAQAVINLYYQTRGLYLDADRKKKVQELTATAGPELDGHQKAVLDALRDPEAAGLQKLLDEHRKPYRGTDADSWFQDAETLAKLKRGVAAFLRQPKPSSQERKQVLAAIEETRKRLKTTAFTADVDALISRVRA